jgi:hypothetical protein
VRPSPHPAASRRPSPSRGGCDLLCDCPTGKSLKTCPALYIKIFRFALTPNHPYNSAIPRPQEGRIAIVTDVGCGERWPRSAGRASRFSQGGLRSVSEARADERRLMRTAKPCGPGTRCWCQAGGGFEKPNRVCKTFNPPATEAKGIRLRGERGISRKPIAQGMPGCSGCTCMLVCASPSAICTRDRGCSKHPAFPAPSFFEGQDSSKPRAHRAARTQTHIQLLSPGLPPPLKLRRAAPESLGEAFGEAGTGRPSIPEAAVIEPISRGVLDTRRSLSSGSPKARPGGGYDDPLYGEWIASLAITLLSPKAARLFKLRIIRNKSLLQVSGDCAFDTRL